MIDTDLVCIFSSSDRARVRRVNERLLDGGVPTVLIPSDRARDRWDIEVPAEAVAAARAIVATDGER